MSGTSTFEGQVVIDDPDDVPFVPYRGTRILSPQDKLQELVEGILASRDGYNPAGAGNRHTIARAVTEGVLGTDFDPSVFYKMMIATKLERTFIAAQRGEVHWDSLLDLAGYMALLADWHKRQAQ